MGKYKLLLLYLSVTACMWLLFPAQAGAIETSWTVREMAFEGTPNDVAYGNSTFVAVGNDGRVWTSRSGTGWQASKPAAKDLFSVEYGNGRFIAVGGEGNTAQVLTSEDGMDWRQSTVQVGVLRNQKSPAIACGKGIFLMVHDGGIILSSKDGINWGRCQSGTEVDLKSVAYGGSMFMAVGEKMTVLTSPDGTNWTRNEVPEIFRQAAADGNNYDCQSVSYLNGRFIITFKEGWSIGAGTPDAVSEKNSTCLLSANGIKWEMASMVGILKPKSIKLNFAPKDLLVSGFSTDIQTSAGYPEVDHRQQAISPNGIMVVKNYMSSDGINWSKGGPNERLCGICWGNGCFLGVGAVARDNKKVSVFLQSDYLGQADLKSLGISTGHLMPDFDPAVLEYKLSVENAVADLTVSATTTESDSVVAINGTNGTETVSRKIDLSVLTTPITVFVKARDGKAKTYTITVVRSAPAPVLKPVKTKVKPVLKIKTKSKVKKKARRKTVR